MWKAHVEMAEVALQRAFSGTPASLPRFEVCVAPKYGCPISKCADCESRRPPEPGCGSTTTEDVAFVLKHQLGTLYHNGGLWDGFTHCRAHLNIRIEAVAHHLARGHRDA